MIQQIITTYFLITIYSYQLLIFYTEEDTCFFQSPICLYIIKNVNLKIYSAIYNCIKI